MGVFSNNVFVDSSTRMVIIGDEMIPFHPKMSGRNITTINGKCYIDGYEWKNGKWKRTFWATWHYLF